jgi:cell division protein FtsW (lipid II flippase)
MFLKYDVITTSIIVALIAIGTVAIYSATYAADIDTGNFFVKQLIWAVTGLSFMFFISLIPIRLINRFAYWIYGISIFLLIMVLFFGRIGQGAERWLVIGPVHIQPSELSKLATVLAVSKYLSDKYADVNQVRYFGISVLLILVPFLLIARQPDLGTALVFLALVIPLLFWAGLNWFAIFTILTPVLTMILSFNFWAFLFLPEKTRHSCRCLFAQYRSRYRDAISLESAAPVSAEANSDICKSGAGSQRCRLSDHTVTGRDRIRRRLGKRIYEWIPDPFAFSSGPAYRLHFLSYR